MSSRSSSIRGDGRPRRGLNARGCCGGAFSGDRGEPQVRAHRSGGPFHRGTRASRQPRLMVMCSTGGLGSPGAATGWARAGGRRRSCADPTSRSLAEHLTGHDPRGSLRHVGRHLVDRHAPPDRRARLDRVAALALAWQIEHNGAWRWEIGEDTAGGYLALSGPTDADSGGRGSLDAAASRSPPCRSPSRSATDFDAAVAALTDSPACGPPRAPGQRGDAGRLQRLHEHAQRRPDDRQAAPADRRRGRGGRRRSSASTPAGTTTAGTGGTRVGEWQPSTTRFPGGLGEVIDAIRAARHGPRPLARARGRSASAARSRTRCRDEAFLQRNGERVVEHHRYHLDLRHPAARRAPGRGRRPARRATSASASSSSTTTSTPAPAPTRRRQRRRRPARAQPRAPGLARRRARPASRARHRELRVRRHADGLRDAVAAAMQSTSDQQDFAQVPADRRIGADVDAARAGGELGVPAARDDRRGDRVLPVTGLLGRFYLSGHLNRDGRAPARLGRGGDRDRQAAPRRDRPRAPALAARPARLGRPVVSLGLRAEAGDLVLGLEPRRPDAMPRSRFPHLVGRDVDVSTEFPTTFPPGTPTGTPRPGPSPCTRTAPAIAARTLRLAARPHRPA